MSDRRTIFDGTKEGHGVDIEEDPSGPFTPTEAFQRAKQLAGWKSGVYEKTSLVYARIPGEQPRA